MTGFAIATPAAAAPMRQFQLPTANQGTIDLRNCDHRSMCQAQVDSAPAHETSEPKFGLVRPTGQTGREHRSFRLVRRPIGRVCGPVHMTGMSIPETQHHARRYSGQVVLGSSPTWLRTSRCIESYFAGRAAAESAARTTQLPDEIADDVVRLLRSVS